MRRFLIVDDSRTSQLHLERALDRAVEGAHETTTVSDAPAALREHATKEFDVVFLDMMLLSPGNSVESSLPTGPLPPRMTSLNLLRQMLARREDQPVVIVSALDRRHPDIVQALSLGATAHIEKGTDYEALPRILASLERKK